ncbi:hypothetical protein CapIbe_011183 [Capra ibex]
MHHRHIAGKVKVPERASFSPGTVKLSGLRFFRVVVKSQECNQQRLLIMEMTPIVQPPITTFSLQKQFICYFQKLLNKQAIYSSLLALLRIWRYAR